MEQGSVLYRMGHGLEFETVEFPGTSISLGELKSLIVEQLKMKSTDFDLEVVDIHNNEEYKHNSVRIPSSSILTIRRVRRDHGQGIVHSAIRNEPTQSIEETNFISTSSLEPEEAALSRLIDAGGNFPSEVPARGRGRGRGTRTYAPPSYYICKKCGKGGHWIDECQSNENFKPVGRLFGVPRSHVRVRNDDNVDGRAGRLWDGTMAVIEAQEDRMKEIRPPSFVNETVVEDVPIHLQCNICKGLLNEALMLKCCQNSCCDECVQNYLEENNGLCPVCKSNLSGDFQSYLVKNSALRAAVTDFKKGLFGKTMLSTEPEQEIQRDEISFPIVENSIVPTRTSMEDEVPTIVIESKNVKVESNSNMTEPSDNPTTEQKSDITPDTNSQPEQQVEPPKQQETEVAPTTNDAQQIHTSEAEAVTEMNIDTQNPSNNIQEETKETEPATTEASKPAPVEEGPQPPDQPADNASDYDPEDVQMCPPGEEEETPQEQTWNKKGKYDDRHRRHKDDQDRKMINIQLRLQREEEERLRRESNRSDDRGHRHHRDDRRAHRTDSRQRDRKDRDRRDSRERRNSRDRKDRDRDRDRDRDNRREHRVERQHKDNKREQPHTRNIDSHSRHVGGNPVVERTLTQDQYYALQEEVLRQKFQRTLTDPNAPALTREEFAVLQQAQYLTGSTQGQTEMPTIYGQNSVIDSQYQTQRGVDSHAIVQSQYADQSQLAQPAENIQYVHYIETPQGLIPLQYVDPNVYQSALVQGSAVEVEQPQVLYQVDPSTGVAVPVQTVPATEPVKVRGTKDTRSVSLVAGSNKTVVGPTQTPPLTTQTLEKAATKDTVIVKDDGDEEEEEESEEEEGLGVDALLKSKLPTKATPKPTAASISQSNPLVPPRPAGLAPLEPVLYVQVPLRKPKEKKNKDLALSEKKRKRKHKHREEVVEEDDSDNVNVKRLKKRKH